MRAAGLSPPNGISKRRGKRGHSAKRQQLDGQASLIRTHDMLMVVRLARLTMDATARADTLLSQSCLQDHSADSDSDEAAAFQPQRPPPPLQLLQLGGPAAALQPLPPPTMLTLQPALNLANAGNSFTRGTDFAWHLQQALVAAQAQAGGPGFQANGSAPIFWS